MNKTLHSNYNAIENQPFLTLKEAALWASSYLGKKVTSSKKMLKKLYHKNFRKSWDCA